VYRGLLRPSPRRNQDELCVALFEYDEYSLLKCGSGGGVCCAASCSAMCSTKSCSHSRRNALYKSKAAMHSFMGLFVVVAAPVPSVSIGRLSIFLDNSANVLGRLGILGNNGRPVVGSKSAADENRGYVAVSRTSHQGWTKPRAVKSASNPWPIKILPLNTCSTSARTLAKLVGAAVRTDMGSKPQ
jgi:hypothetical protein